jgi:dsDNA-binding SOS-regulon protein
MSFQKMFQDFKDDVELRAFAEAQYQTILELSKKIQKLEEENSHLKQLLENSTPVLEEQKKELLGFNLDASNEEIIATIQLNKIKQISYDRELTLEETKKVEIFSKILAGLKSKTTKQEEAKPEALSNEDLMKLLSAAADPTTNVQ